MKSESKREYPVRPVIGVGGVVVSDGKALLIRRASPPLAGQWSIPGGALEAGETLTEGVRRELLEETGIEVRVLEMIEVFERIEVDAHGRARYHYVVLDYLCTPLRGEARPGSDAAAVAWASSEELPQYALTPTASRVIEKAIQMAKEREPSAGR